MLKRKAGRYAGGDAARRGAALRFLQMEEVAVNHYLPWVSAIAMRQEGCINASPKI
jgi:hypothetical protein